MPVLPGAATNDPAGYTWADAQRSVGEGWHRLLAPVFDALVADGGVIVQVKEKFGTLRAYGDQLSPRARGRIHEAEALSSACCETCGHWGQTGGAGWIQTTCLLHGLARQDVTDVRERLSRALAPDAPAPRRRPWRARPATERLAEIEPFTVGRYLEAEAWGPRARLEEAMGCSDIPAATRQQWAQALWDAGMPVISLAPIVAALDADLGPLAARVPRDAEAEVAWAPVWAGLLRRLPPVPPGVPLPPEAEVLLAHGVRGASDVWDGWISWIWQQPLVDWAWIRDQPLIVRAGVVGHPGLTAAQITTWLEHEADPMVRDRLLLHPATPAPVREAALRDPQTPAPRRLLLLAAGGVSVGAWASGAAQVMTDLLAAPGVPDPRTGQSLAERVALALPALAHHHPWPAAASPTPAAAALAPWLGAAGVTDGLQVPGVSGEAADAVVTTLAVHLPPAELHALGLDRLRPLLRRGLLAADPERREGAVRLAGRLGTTPDALTASGRGRGR